MSSITWERITALPDDSDCEARPMQDTCHATSETPGEIGGKVILVCCKAEDHDGRHTDTHRSIEWQINREQEGTA